MRAYVCLGDSVACCCSTLHSVARSPHTGWHFIRQSLVALVRPQRPAFMAPLVSAAALLDGFGHRLIRLSASVLFLGALCRRRHASSKPATPPASYIFAMLPAHSQPCGLAQPTQSGCLHTASCRPCRRGFFPLPWCQPSFSRGGFQPSTFQLGVECATCPTSAALPASCVAHLRRLPRCRPSFPRGGSRPTTFQLGVACATCPTSAALPASCVAHLRRLPWCQPSFPRGGSRPTTFQFGRCLRSVPYRCGAASLLRCPLSASRAPSLSRSCASALCFDFFWYVCSCHSYDYLVGAPPVGARCCHPVALLPAVLVWYKLGFDGRVRLVAQQ
jgi:hypothetical protein